MASRGKITGHGVMRLDRALRKLEGPSISDRPPTAAPTPVTAHPAIIRVTSATPTSDRYPGKLQTYDLTAKTWSDGADCWVVGPNGETLTTERYHCRLMGILAADSKAVFVASGNVSSATAFSGARVYDFDDTGSISGTQTLEYDNERYDTDSYHDTSSNRGRLTAPTTGYYHIGAYVEFNNITTAGDVGAFIRRNGSDSVFLTAVEAVATTDSSMDTAMSCDYFLSAGDYVEVRVYELVSGSASVRSREFWIHRLGT